MKKYSEINQTELMTVNGGGKKDYNFGYTIGRTIHKGAMWVWKNTLGCVGAY